jgi:selenocysteine-specific translation elongation factor
VGFALKGVNVEDLDRGTVLTSNTKIVSRKVLAGRAELVEYWPKPLTVGMIVHLGHWMQFEPARIESIEGEDQRNPLLKLSLQKDLVYLPGSRAVITYLEGAKLRVAATMELP